MECMFRLQIMQSRYVHTYAVEFLHVHTCIHMYICGSVHIIIYEITNKPFLLDNYKSTHIYVIILKTIDSLYIN